MKNSHNKFRIDSARLKGHDYSDPGMYFVTICTNNREKSFGQIINELMVLSNIGKIADYFWREIPKHFPFVKLDEYIVMPNHIHGLIQIQNHNHTPGLNQIKNRNRRDVALPRLGNGNNDKNQKNIVMFRSENLEDGKTISYGDGKTIPYGNGKTIPYGNGKTIPYGNGETISFGDGGMIDDEELVHRDVAVPRLYGGMSEMHAKSGSISVIIGSFKGVVTKQARLRDPGTNIWQERFYDNIVRNETDLQNIRMYIKNNPINWTQDRN